MLPMISGKGKNRRNVEFSGGLVLLATTTEELAGCELVKSYRNTVFSGGIQ